MFSCLWRRRLIIAFYQQQAIETPPPYSAQQTTPASEPNNVSLRVNGLPVPATTHTHTPPPRTPQLPICPTQPPPPNVTPINHKHIYAQQERLRQQFVIDPYLQSPGCPPPQYIIDDDNDTDASGNGIASRSKTVYSDHRNLKILIQDGDVNADIWILGGNESTLPTRVSIEITVHNGPITLRIVRLPNENAHTFTHSTQSHQAHSTSLPTFAPPPPHNTQRTPNTLPPSSTSPPTPHRSPDNSHPKRLGIPLTSALLRYNDLQRIRPNSSNS